MSPIPEDRRRSVRRTALVLGLIALAFYIGFIMIGVYRSQMGSQIGSQMGAPVGVS